MTLLLLGSTFLAACQLCSMLLVSRHKPSGWLFAIAVQAAWIPYDIVTRQFGFLAISAVSVPVYLHGWRNFRRAGRDRDACAAPRGEAPEDRRRL